MKVLIADKFPAGQIEALANKGHDVTFMPELTGDDLPGALAGAEILVVRSTRVSAGALEQAAGLKLIIRAGSGTNTIDKEAAAGKGIYVCNVPGKNAIAVAELTLGLILAIDRHIPDNVMELRAERWNKATWSKARGLYGRSLGIVGLGAIGLEVAARAHAFGMQLFAIHKAGRPRAMLQQFEAVGMTFVADIATLAATCDILTFHVPAAQETRHLVNADLLGHVRPGTVLINTSRGDLIDENALIAALEEKGIWAGLDVYAAEPAAGQADFDSPLARHPQVYGTHHIGASTYQAQDAVANGVIEVIDAFVGGEIMNCVNEWR